jgi:hypothetical protein
MAQTKTQKRYEMCSICHEPFSYPEMPYRVYEVYETEYGVASSGRELYASSESNDAERWAAENCRRIVTCV